jgi:zona occludens toxin
MAISAYIGIPGSGKSYEAVCMSLFRHLPGRRVVTNIYGLQKDKITERYPDATEKLLLWIMMMCLKQISFLLKVGMGAFASLVI